MSTMLSIAGLHDDPEKELVKTSAPKVADMIGARAKDLNSEVSQRQQKIAFDAAKETQEEWFKNLDPDLQSALKGMVTKLSDL